MSLNASCCNSRQVLSVCSSSYPSIGAPSALTAGEVFQYQTPLVIDLSAGPAWSVSATVSAQYSLIDYTERDAVHSGAFATTIKRFAPDGVTLIDTPVAESLDNIVFVHTSGTSRELVARFIIPLVATLPRGRYQLSGNMVLSTPSESYTMEGFISLFSFAVATHQASKA